MECKLTEEPPLFTVSIGNIKMEYPIIPILNICPNWTASILNDKILILDENMDLNGVRSFFDGILQQKIQIKEENCETILKLGQMGGSDKIIEDAQRFINQFCRTIPELLEEVIHEKQEEDQKLNSDINNQFDQHSKEVYLSKNYNEILKYPELLKKVDISQHYRIVKQALNYYGKDEFNYRGFISFVLDLIEKENGRKYMMLLSLLKFDDFDLKEIERLCNSPNFDENVLDYKIVNFISKMKENNEKIAIQEERIKSIQYQLNESINQNKQFIEEISLKLSTFISNQQNLIIEFNQQNQQLFNNQISRIEKMISDQQDSINVLHNQNKKTIDDKLSSFESDLKNEIENNHKLIKQQNDILCSNINSNMTNQQIFLSNFVNSLINEKLEIFQSKFKYEIDNNQIQIKQQNDEMKQLNKQLNDEIKQQNKQLINEKIESIKFEINKEIENNQKQNKQLIDEQSSRIEKLFKDQQNLINNNKQQNNQQFDEKLSSCNSELKREISKFQNILINIDQIKKEINEFKSLKITNEKGKCELISYVNNSNAFNGILTRLGNGNPINALNYQIINITVSSIYSSDNTYQPINVLNYNDACQTFNSKDEQNSWFCIDFKKHRVNPTHYSIKSNGHGGKSHYHPQSWNVEGSNDDKNWEILDIRRNERSLDDKAASNTFEISNKTINGQYYRYLKIEQKDLNTSSKNNWFSFSAIEFFGSILNTLNN